MRDDEAALRLFESSFTEKKSLMAKPMVFVKAGTYDAATRKMITATKSQLYMPTKEEIEKKLRQKDEYDRLSQLTESEA